MPKSKAEEKEKQPTDRNAYILKEISKELVHLENMLSRVQALSPKLSHRSYIERIILRIEYVARALKEYRDFIKIEQVNKADINKEMQE